MQKLVVTKKGVKVVKLSKKELEVRKQEETVQAAHREKTKYARLRQEEFIAREKKGDLPSTLHDHLDLIYKALEAAELNGTELPPEMSSVIRIRRAIKTKHPKPKK